MVIDGGVVRGGSVLGERARSESIGTAEAKPRRPRAKTAVANILVIRSWGLGSRVRKSGMAMDGIRRVA